MKTLKVQLVGPLTSFRKPEQLSVGVAINKPDPLSHLHVNNAHLVTWKPYAKFQPV